MYLSFVTEADVSSPYLCRKYFSLSRRIRTFHVPSYRETEQHSVRKKAPSFYTSVLGMRTFLRCER